MRITFLTTDSTLDELSSAFGISFSCGVTAANCRNEDETIYYYGLSKVLWYYIQKAEFALVVEDAVKAANEERINVYRNRN